MRYLNYKGLIRAPLVARNIEQSALQIQGFFGEGKSLPPSPMQP